MFEPAKYRDWGPGPLEHGSMGNCLGLLTSRPKLAAWGPAPFSAAALVSAEEMAAAVCSKSAARAAAKLAQASFLGSGGSGVTRSQSPTPPSPSAIGITWLCGLSPSFGLLSGGLWNSGLEKVSWVPERNTTSLGVL